MNQLDALRRHTVVVADTGSFLDLARYAPQDATTNPSLILKAVRQADYAPLLERTLAAHPRAPRDEQVDRLLVAFGVQILKLIPGRVSTEVDARLSFDAEATVRRARRLVELYAAEGIDRARVLVKIASTWEGIEAARRLEADGIACNLTLLFSFAQALACADARVTLISPFVGRILDWAKKQAGAAWDDAANAGAADPGVRSVERIWRHYKRRGVATQVMGASFRNVGQIVALAGCDLLTIAPELLARLQAERADVPRRLDPDAARAAPHDPAVDDRPFEPGDEPGFRFALNADAMAVEKLAEGIRGFAADADALDALIAARLG